MRTGTPTGAWHSHPGYSGVRPSWRDWATSRPALSHTSPSSLRKPPCTNWDRNTHRTGPGAGDAAHVHGVLDGGHPTRRHVEVEHGRRERVAHHQQRQRVERAAVGEREPAGHLGDAVAVVVHPARVVGVDAARRAGPSSRRSRHPDAMRAARSPRTAAARAARPPGARRREPDPTGHRTRPPVGGSSCRRGAAPLPPWRTDARTSPPSRRPARARLARRQVVSGDADRVGTPGEVRAALVRRAPSGTRRWRCPLMSHPSWMAPTPSVADVALRHRTRSCPPVLTAVGARRHHRRAAGRGAGGSTVAPPTRRTAAGGCPAGTRCPSRRARRTCVAPPSSSSSACSRRPNTAAYASHRLGERVVAVDDALVVERHVVVARRGRASSRAWPRTRRGSTTRRRSTARTW